ncbi:perlucin-like [Mizuhopecten yessoensis]|uniref:Perlucin n=1 Tax=Mizuhopecten yessoensis TaxID=6573 RepID=A0A210PS00_MIZYE|nr:perlucin-like [Mizuhopecten yessoensis]OWF39261.1 Perlucin [Mizuhopecten yessoensis]
MLVYGIICLLFAAVVNADCPAGFIQDQYSCYKLFNNTFTWPEATSFCRAFNTHLLTLENDAELTFIKKKAAEVGGLGFWTAGSDALEENEWIWAETGETLTLTGDWAPGEPDQTLGKDCLGLWGAHGYLFGSWGCNALLQPICEISIEEALSFG